MTKKALPVERDHPAPVTNTDDANITRAKEVFASHDIDEVYFTSDGTAFTQPQFARLHSENLSDSTVLTIKRQEV